jgi:hypothetical protein
MHSVCSVAMHDALVLQVDSLSDLLDGWFDDAIEPYSTAALDWLATLLDHLVKSFKVPIPYVYPTSQGLVRAGWATARWDVIADIDLETHAVGVFACKVATHEVHERQLLLEVPGSEAVLGRFVAGHTR